jgi:hypothetical protein
VLPPGSSNPGLISPLSQNDVLIRYLLDEMGALEEDYSDALAPLKSQCTGSLADKASLVAPVTVGEYRLGCQQQESALTAKMGAMEQRLSTQMHSEISQALRHHPDPMNSRSAGM